MKITSEKLSSESVAIRISLTKFETLRSISVLLSSVPGTFFVPRQLVLKSLNVNYQR